MNMKNVTKASLFGIIALLIVSCGGDELGTLKTEREELKTQITAAEARISEIDAKIIEIEGIEAQDFPDVTVAVANKQVFEHYISVQGQIEAENMVMVTPEVGGVINSLKVKEGDHVQKGQTIVTFDSKDIASSKAEIQTQLEVAMKIRDKQQTLYDQGLGNIIQLDQANGQVASLEQALKTLSTQGSKFSVEAPFTGVIEKVYVVEGQVAGPTSPLVMLIDEGQRKVVAQLSETYLKNVAVGSKVDVEMGVLGKTLKDLRVSRVGGYIDPVNRTIDLEVKLNEIKDDKVVPNLMVNVKVRDVLDSNAIVIPSKVILKGADQLSYVFTLQKNAELSDSVERYNVVKTVVETGSMYEGFTVVTNGLNSGDIVVNRGKSDIYVDAVVEISEQ